MIGASSAAEASEVIDDYEGEIDVLLMDINLPGMSGIEVIRALKSHDTTGNIPVVAVSGDAMQAQIDEAREEGF